MQFWDAYLQHKMYTYKSGMVSVLHWNASANIQQKLENLFNQKYVKITAYEYLWQVQYLKFMYTIRQIKPNVKLSASNMPCTFTKG